MTKFRSQTPPIQGWHLNQIVNRIDDLEASSNRGIGGGFTTSSSIVGGTGGSGLQGHLAEWTGGSGSTTLGSSYLTENLTGGHENFSFTDPAFTRVSLQVTAGSGSNITCGQQIVSTALAPSGVSAGEYPKHAMYIKNLGGPQNKLGVNLDWGTGFFWNGPSGTANTAGFYMDGNSVIRTALKFNGDYVFENGVGGPELMRIAANVNPVGMNAAALVIRNFRWLTWQDSFGGIGGVGNNGIQLDDSNNLNICANNNGQIALLNGFGFSPPICIWQSNPVVIKTTQGTAQNFPNDGYLCWKNTGGTWLYGTGANGITVDASNNLTINAEKTYTIKIQDGYAGTLIAEFGNANVTSPGTPPASTSLAINGIGWSTTALGWQSVSDERLKQNIEPISNALAMVNGMRGVRFEMKSEPGKKVVGLIGQEVEKVLPEVVSRSTGPEEYRSMAYDGVIPVLLEAVKELSEKVKRLEKA